MERHSAYDRVVATNRFTLLDNPPSDSSWYKIDFAPVYKVNSKYYQWCNRWPKEIEASVAPDLEQLIFYVLPLFFLTAFRLRMLSWPNDCGHGLEQVHKKEDGIDETAAKD
jgi:hypothetical protein